jgi:hypothetical protein
MLIRLHVPVGAVPTQAGSRGSNLVNNRMRLFKEVYRLLLVEATLL